MADTQGNERKSHACMRPAECCHGRSSSSGLHAPAQRTGSWAQRPGPVLSKDLQQVSSATGEVRRCGREEKGAEKEERRGERKQGEPDRRWKKRSRSYCYTHIYHEAIMTSFVSASKTKGREREGKRRRERESGAAAGKGRGAQS
jgi:hypothetical protein